MDKKIVRVLSIIIAFVLLTCCFAGCGDERNFEKTGDVTTTDPAKEQTTDPIEIPENINTLTGKADLSASAVNGRPIAIMVENSPAARPQWGITTPDIVVEGVAEGGITRMMWIYSDIEDIPNKVGPVRSARHDFVEIASGMNAIFVHWGGSDGSRVGKTLGYQTIRNLKVNNIDGMDYSGSYFFRDTTRNVSSEHRGYTTQNAIKNAISKLGYSTKQTVSDWQPYDILLEGQKLPWGDTDVTGACSEITVTFSNGYVHTFKYNANEKVYYNYLNNNVMTDGNNGEKMAVENVIVLYVPVTTLDTKEGHKEWNFEVSNGEGFYVSNGVGQRIYWSKAGKDKPLKLKSFDGKELVINNGQVWMGIVPDGNRSLTSIKE